MRCFIAICLALSVAASASEDSSSKVPDALRLSFKQTPAWSVRCTHAVVLKLEEKSDLEVLKSITSLEKVGSNKRYEIRLKDQWDETFTIECTLDGVLLSETKHRVPLRLAPKDVREAADEWAPGANWNSTTEVETERGKPTIYEVRGEVSGKSIKADIDEHGTLVKASKLPADVQSQPHKKRTAPAPATEAEKKESEKSDASTPPAKVTDVLERPKETETEHDPSLQKLPQLIRESFAVKYPTACVIRTRNKNESWMRSVITLDETVADLLEISASDRYNKELKLIYRVDGKLYSAEKHLIPMDTVPAKAREAAAKWAGDATLAPLVRTQMAAGAPQIYTFTAKLDGKKYEGTFNEFGALNDADKLPQPKSEKARK